MMSARLPTFNAVADSPSARMPKTAISAVPAADHTAYVVPTDSSRSTSASSQNEVP
jgi:hypothetical protein